MSGVASNNSLRKALGSIKDTTTISLAKVNSDYSELDVAIVKATNHVERPAKEKHIRAIFAAVSATRPRADVAYCIHALARRLSKTRNWAVALKTLILIHRALREVDPTFQEELISYERRKSHMLNMAHFKDDSSANAWDYSAWVRSYALYLEERLECFRTLKYDIVREPSRTKDLDTVDLLEHLPALQQLLHRVLGCQPEGASVHNFVIQLALSMVASESMKIYWAIADGTVNLVDKFFEMQRQDAIRALDIYRRDVRQAERLSEFYELCRNLDICRGERFIKIEQPPASFLHAMEEYVREAPRGSTFRKEQVKVVTEDRKEVLAIEEKKVTNPTDKHPASPVKDEKVVAETPDLLGLDESKKPDPVVSDTDDKNASALALVPIDLPTKEAPSPNLQNGATGWELALVTAPSSNEPSKDATKLDFCVGINDPKAAVFVNGLFCKNPMKATPEDFLFKGLNIPRPTNNKQGSNVTLVSAANLPGLNTLGISLARIDYAPYGLNPPHIHPRATEILTVIEGTLYVGFVTSNLPAGGGNKFFSKVLYPGDVFVFPQGLIHFQFNIGKKPAVAIAGLSSQNPGTATIANAVFGAEPPISVDVLAKAFQVDDKVIKLIESRF